MISKSETVAWIESRIFWIAATVVIVLVYFFGLTIPLVGPDEPRYAQVAREMFERGDWVTPTLGGHHWFEKPALLYWLQITSYNIFGVTEFAARFGSALFGLGTTASLWILGRRIATESTETLPFNEKHLSVHSVANFGNLLGLVSASSIGIIVFARGASFDIILTFPMTAALVSYYIFDRRTQPPATAGGSHIVPLCLFYFFIGLALLAKGLIGIVFPFAIVVFYHVLYWKWPSARLIVSLFWGTLISVLVASAWYLPMYLTHGWPFIDEFFIQHHFQRYTSNKYFHPQPFYFFVWVLPLMTIPWLPFFFVGLWSSVKDIFFRNGAKTQSEENEKGGGGESEMVARVAASPSLPVSLSPLFLFSFAWLLVPLVFFSFSGSKLPGYILPALPPALIVAAMYISRFIGTNGRRTASIVAIAGTTFAVIVVLILFVVPQYADGDSIKRLIAEADARGYGKAEVLSQHSISHNAEFYAAGRLLRSEDGRQIRLYGPHEILNEIRRRNGETVLVLVPNEWASQTMNSPLLSTEFIAKNAEHSIIAARERSSQP